MTAASDFKADPHDFDFLIGSWAIHNRRLLRRHVGSDDWDEFDSTLRFWTLLDGVANVDEFDCPDRGFKGTSVRTLDLATGLWSIYWVNSTRGILEPPVRGGFNGDKGEFIGGDVDGDIPIVARFRWTVHPDTPRWEQSFSTDKGATWEPNWIMEFERR